MTPTLVATALPDNRSGSKVAASNAGDRYYHNAVFLFAC
jgi:hypothetical protein